MGRFVDIETAAAILGITAVDDMEILTDPSDGERLGVAVQGTAVVTFFDAPGMTANAAVHDHDTVEEAQQCASDVLDEVRHALAEQAAMAGDPTVALSRIDAPLTAFMVI